MPVVLSIGSTLLLVGLGLILNAAISSTVSSGATATIAILYDTHWITSVVVFAGLALLVPHVPEAAVFLINLLTMAICGAAVVADLVSLPYVQGRAPISQSRRNLASLYYVSDALLSGVSLVLSGIVVRAHFLKSCVEPSPIPRNRSPLLTIGTAVACTASLRFLVWMFGLHGWAKAEPQIGIVVRSIDEPVWGGVGIATGILIVFSTRAGRLLKQTALALCVLCLLPTLHFVWIDYRILGGTLAGHFDRLSNATVSDSWIDMRAFGVWVYSGALLIGVIHLGLIMTALLALCDTLTREQNDVIRKTVELAECSTRAICTLAGGLAVTSLLLVLLGLYAAQKNYLYRMYFGSEERTPTVALITTVFAALAAQPKYTTVAVPLCLCFALYACCTPIYTILIFIHIAFGAGTDDAKCSLFFPNDASCGVATQDNDDGVVHSPSLWLHFLEAALELVALVVAVALSWLLYRLIRLYRTEERDDATSREGSLSNNSNARVLTEWHIKLLGGCMLVGWCAGSTLFLRSVSARTSVYDIAAIDSNHLNLRMVIALQPVCNSAAVPVFAILQMMMSTSMSRYPLSAIFVATANAIRSVDILCQIDWPMPADLHATPQTARQMALLLLIGAQALSVLLSLKLLRITKFLDLESRPHQSRSGRRLNDEMHEFANPLANF